MLFVQPTPTRHSTSELLDALRHPDVPVIGHNTPGQPERQMKETEHRSGTFFSGESRILEQQKAQHSTSSTSQNPSTPRHPEIFYMLHVEHLGLPFESFTVQAVRGFFPVSFPVTR